MPARCINISSKMGARGMRSRNPEGVFRFRSEAITLHPQDDVDDDVYVGYVNLAVAIDVGSRILFF